MPVHVETDSMEAESSGRASESNGRAAESVKMPQEFPTENSMGKFCSHASRSFSAASQLLVCRGLGAKHLQFHTALVKKATPTFPFHLGQLSTLLIIKLY